MVVAAHLDPSKTAGTHNGAANGGEVKMDFNRK
jgi:hypothetical protein